MKSKTQLFLEMWLEARARFSTQLTSLTEEELKKKLPPSPNSLGFLIRHIGEVEMLFAKNVFKALEIRVHAKTVIDQKDSGEWTNLKELLAYVDESFALLKEIVEKQTDEDWETLIETKEFGKRTKAQAFGRIVSHTTYHSGQMALIRKYGTN
ncbi:MAG: DinB family protein [Bacteroidia bacterium]|nr:DinB family protein [Bacteroidia bacterium]